jgi:hypothetical protein
VLYAIGTFTTGAEIGSVAKYVDTPYMWVNCQRCGAESWVRCKRSKPIYKLCYKCRKLDHPKFTGKRKGYIRICLSINDFFFPMAGKGHYVLEHRLVVARNIGRCLHRWEVVHHINGIKSDNRLSNLQLVTDERHQQITVLENYIKVLEKRIQKLTQENNAIIKPVS